MLGHFKLASVMLASTGLLMCTTPIASAADLGGNCCVDLEERIAELEATTVRKGNRKVSLQVTGWVSSQLYYFDDEFEQNVYVVDNSTDLATNVKFTGTAQITPNIKAGYTLWLYTEGGGNSLAVDQNNDEVGNGITVQHSYWFLDSTRLGKLSVGLQSAAGDNAALGTDFSGTLFPANSVTFDGGFMKLRPAGGSGVAGYGAGVDGTWQAFLWCENVGIGIGGDCAGLRTNAVRYDTPVFGGFSGSVSWGEDDTFDVAGRYAGEHAGFKISAAVALTHNTDNAGVLKTVDDTDYFQAGITVKHLASNLWVHSVYGHEDTDSAGVPDGEHFYLKAGWSPKFLPLGITHLYGEYGINSDMFGALAESAHPGATCAAFGGTTGSAIATACGLDGTTHITDSEVTRWGLGIVQDIDPASMALWAKWRLMDLEADFANNAGTINGKQDFEVLNMFLAGAVVFF